MNKFAIKRTGQLQIAAFRAPKDPNGTSEGYTNLELVSTDAGKVEVLDDMYIKGDFSKLNGKKVEALIEVSARMRGTNAELRCEAIALTAI